MHRLGRIGRAAHDSSGAVLVMVALSLPVLFGFTSLVIDVGNWFEHRRHLQVQADAGALAAAGEFRIGDACDPVRITAMEASYSGVDHNPQVGDTPPENVLRAYNSQTWPNQSSPVDPTPLTGDPCEDAMIDLKLTETDLPWFFRVAQVPFINAHARVAFRKQTTSRGALPVGVPDVNPRAAQAQFVDEATGAVIASTPLVRTGSDADGLALWSNTAAPLPVTIDRARIGVRITLSGSDSMACGEPLVDCYDAGSTGGVVHVRGWSGTPVATVTAPQARDVTLSGGTCRDGYFMAAPTDPTPCTIGVGAEVDLGGSPAATAKIVATRAGANTKYPLTYSTATGRWTSASTIPVAAGGGPVDVTLEWSTGCPTTGNGRCANTGSFGVVHRGFGGAENRSGPIRSVRILEDGIPGANSFERCATCTHDLVVSIGLQGSLGNAQSVADPIVTLKVAGGGSQNQALDCDPATANLKDELAGGCVPKYAINQGELCPGGAAALWGTPQPWRCVAISTGATTNQVPAGLNLRILGDENASACTSPNNWADFPDIPRGDPRIVELFLTPFGSFSGSGGGTVPVTGFATFYITGWSGQGNGFANPCQGAGGDDEAGTGSIVGHFIKYIDTINDGGAGDEPCDDGFGRCVAVLTR